MSRSPNQTLMESEARETPEAVARLVANVSGELKELGERLRQLSPRYALAAGRGSSDAAALLAKYLLEVRLGLPTVSAAPSVRSIYGAQLRLEKALVLAISQSGRSPDLVEFCRSATGPDVLRVGLINDASSPLSGAVDVVVPLEAGPEKSVAATKSCLAAMALVFGLVAHWRNDSDMIAAFERSPRVLADALKPDWPEADAFLEGVGAIYVIGRGPGLAVAAEAALKLKETCALHAEAFSSAEVKHGPMALVRTGFPVLMFTQRDDTRQGIEELAAEFASRGARVLLAGTAARGAVSLPAVEANPVLEPLLAIQSFYAMANALALTRGLDPDRPPHLNKVTETV